MNERTYEYFILHLLISMIVVTDLLVSIKRRKHVFLLLYLVVCFLNCEFFIVSYSINFIINPISKKLKTLYSSWGKKRCRVASCFICCFHPPSCFLNENLHPSLETWFYSKLFRASRGLVKNNFFIFLQLENRTKIHIIRLQSA